MDVPSSWDELRKQARKIEAQLDEQMHSYRRLVSTKSDGVESDLEGGIDLLLRQLQQVNARMKAWVSSGGSEMVSHTLTRHQEILQDLSQEFNRHRSSLRAKQEHASLLEDFKEFDRTRLDLEAGGMGRQSKHCSKNMSESTAIQRSPSTLNSGVLSGCAPEKIDGVISQAQATLGTLVFQRSSFGGINSKLSNVTSRLATVQTSLLANCLHSLLFFVCAAMARVIEYYHQVNTILSAIKRKKSMDTIILSLVAAVCTFLILIYWLTK